MKRPKGIYPVLIWFVLAFSMQTGPLFRVANSYSLANQNTPLLWQLISVGLLALFICIMTGLFRLQNTFRWIAIVFFGACIIGPILKLIFGYSHLNNMVIFLLLVFSIPNFLSIWYLSSKKFIKQSEEFRKEKELIRAMRQARK